MQAVQVELKSGFSSFKWKLKLQEDKYYISLFTWVWQMRAVLGRTPISLIKSKYTAGASHPDVIKKIIW